MRNRKQKQLIKWAIIGVIVVAFIVYLAWPKSIPNYEKKYADVDIEAETARLSAEAAKKAAETQTKRADNYSIYKLKLADKKAGTSVIDVDLTKFTNGKDTAMDTIEGVKALVTKDGGSVDLTFDAPEEGLYTIYVEYFPLGGRKDDTYESRGVDPERALYIYNAETGEYVSGKMSYEGFYDEYM